MNSDPYADLSHLCGITAFSLPPPPLPLPAPRPSEDRHITDLFGPIPGHLFSRYLCYDDPSPDLHSFSSISYSPSATTILHPLPHPLFLHSPSPCPNFTPHDSPLPPPDFTAPPSSESLVISHPYSVASGPRHVDSVDHEREILPPCVVNYQDSLYLTPEQESCSYSAALGVGDSGYENWVANSLPSEINEMSLCNPNDVLAEGNGMVGGNICRSHQERSERSMWLNPMVWHLLFTLHADLLPVIWSGNFRGNIRFYSDLFQQRLSQSMSNIVCGPQDKVSEGCRDTDYALILKMVAIAAILTAGVCGVAIPLLGKKRRFLRTDSNLFVAAKAFAAGVILATGFVHMLPDATSSLTSPCLPEIPWSKFPFSGFIAMMAALATLLADFIGTQYYARKRERESPIVTRSDSLDAVSESGIIQVEPRGWNSKVFGEEEGGAMHIVGMHAHAAHHRHSHSQEEGACEGRIPEHSHSHSHSRGIGNGDDDADIRHIVVSQVLELGIVSHSVIIGLSLGVSHSPCTIKPLIGALSFHQFFEGFALGGCISQAHFRTLHSTLMACFFALTTPIGIAVGIGISSIYNSNSPRALVIEGVFDSISAGILVYMALVDLIAADFLSKRMSCNVRLQVLSYFALFIGATMMSLLALWA